MGKICEYQINFKEIEINKDEIGRIIGYASSNIPHLVTNQIQEVLSEIKDYCHITGGFKYFENIQLHQDKIIIEQKVFHPGITITNALLHAETITIFVCTAGEKINKWLKKLFKTNNPTKAYIADIIASLIVEKATDQLQGYLEKRTLAEQKQITHRYSPGYCNWNVAEQHMLFSLLPEKFCGVSLNKAALMNPIKSVSGIIGIGKLVKKNIYHCDQCNKEVCLLSHKKII